MSPELISRSPDLSRLRTEGYDLQMHGAFLLVRDVPYLDANGTIVRGTLVKALTISGDVADRPSDHMIHLAGPLPYDRAGRPLDRVVHSSATQELATGVTVDHWLSHKPANGYEDHHDLITTYIAALSKHAFSKDDSATARTYPVIRLDDDVDSIFTYLDTGSARSGVAAINDYVRGQSIGIVGLGGTGAYILDLVAKTPVAEIHLFDGDKLMQHNAFRYPGVVPLEVVTAKPMKTDYLAEHYRTFRRGVESHPHFIDTDNMADLTTLDFVFVAVDDNPSRVAIATGLEDAGRPFIDVGMGLYVTDGAIGGQLRTTTSVSQYRDHLWDQRKRLPTRVSTDDIYDQNVQIIDLNALNAALAVGRWKRQAGMYADHSGEHHSVYAIDGNLIINEDHA